MAITKISTDTIDLSSDTTALKMPKGTTGERPGSFSCSYLIVGGGGAGGAGTGRSGGGGAGAFVTASGVVLQPNVAYGIEVGAGGLIPGLLAVANGGNGGTSTFNSITAIGGGGGGGAGAGSSGASGGGGAADSPGTHSGGSGTQGNNGGTGYYSGSNFSAGGGGGAGAAGQSGSLGNYSGAGGVGLTTTLITTAMATTYSVGEVDSGNVYFAGGGGGGWSGSGVPGVGGLGGGADGNSNTPYVPGAPNSGGGGGGFYKDTGAVGCCAGTNGGSGVIILSVDASSATVTSGVTVNGSSGAGTVSGISNGSNYVYIITVAGASDTITFLGSTGEIGMMRENTTTGKMEIYTGAKGWRALQQTGQDVGIVPSNNFNTALYTGNASIRSINVGFKPDLTWIKDRTTNYSHAVIDSVRGPNSEINSNDTTTAYTETSGLTAFTSTGFDLGTLEYSYNKTNDNYVSWNWKAGGAATTIGASTVGNDIASDVSVNTAAGFSIVKYTATLLSSGNLDVAHGLGTPPEIIISKSLTTTAAWRVRPFFLNSNPYNYLELNNTNAIADLNISDGTMAMPTANVFSNNWNGSVGGAADIIAYCWHSVPGYSLIGSYIGTGSATISPKIYTGFEPAWLMTKPTSTTGWWYIFDNKRSTSNPRDRILGANSSDQEYTSSNYNVNFYNDGFQYRNNTICCNEAGVEYIFMCFAS